MAGLGVETVRTASKASLRGRPWTGRQEADSALNARVDSLHESMHRRIASELHDSTCQHLIAASLSVMRLRSIRSDPRKMAQICDEIDAELDQVLNELRAFTYLLYPQALMTNGLKATIEQYAKALAERTPLNISVRISASVDSLSHTKQLSLLRVIQEALANVYRHAKARNVTVTIQGTGSGFELIVSDDGCGMPIDQAKSDADALSRGVGIPAMKARFRHLGGALEIRETSEAGHTGTVLCGRFPHDPVIKRRRLQKK